MLPRLIEAAIGIALMAAPGLLGYNGAPATSHQVVGPIAAALAIVAVWETTRGVRWGVLPAGVWLMASTPFLGGPAAAQLTGLIAGAALAVLPLLGGRTTGRYGGGWRTLVRGSRTAQHDASPRADV